MFRHVVIIRWTEPPSQDVLAEFGAALDALARESGTVRSFGHGSNTGERAGNADYCLIADFEDIEGWRVYDQHPAHALPRQFLGRLASDHMVAQYGDAD